MLDYAIPRRAQHEPQVSRAVPSGGSRKTLLRLRRAALQVVRLLFSCCHCCFCCLARLYVTPLCSHGMKHEANCERMTLFSCAKQVYMFPSAVDIHTPAPRGGGV